MKKDKIGFIGQGWIGKNYADNYEVRGYEVIRYSLEPEYVVNKNLIKTCDIVFVAVPTPTTEKGFDLSFVEKSISDATVKGQNIVIKSTMLAHSTEKLAKKFPDRYIFHSPEFLSERSAKYDVERPHSGILGMPKKTKEYEKRAKQILETFPYSPFQIICTSLEAELMKYSRNIHGFFEVLFYNLFYDYATAQGADYEVIKKYIQADPLHVARYATPMFDSGHKRGILGRGAGGHCFIKDFKAFRESFGKLLNDKKGLEVLQALENKNIELLKNSKKDLDLLSQVYGKKF